MRVLAVPRSTAISLAGNQDIRFNPGNFIEEPLGTWVEKVLGLLPVWKRAWSPLRATASEAAGASGGRGQHFDWLELDPLDPCYDHLRDAHPACHPEWLGAQIHHRHHQLTPIVAVDGRRCVWQRDPVLQGQSGPGPELTLVAVRDRDAESGPEQLPLQGSEITILCAGEVVPG